MATIGILIETEDGNVKETNFGVLTAARRQGDATIIAFLAEGSAGGAEDALGRTTASEPTVSIGHGEPAVEGSSRASRQRVDRFPVVGAFCPGAGFDTIGQHQ